MKTLTFLILLVLPCSAQIQTLATSGNGQEVWFGSLFNLKTEPGNAPRESRIYRYAAPGAEIIARPDPTRPNLFQPFLSTDGQTTGWHSYVPCFGSCMLPIARTGLVLTRNGKSITYQNRNTLNLSRNGKWLYEAGFPNFLGSSMTDLDTGNEVPARDLVPLSVRHAVSDDGMVIGVDPIFRGIPGPSEEVKLWTIGSDPRTIYKGEQALFAGISADGSVALVATKNTLFRIDPTSGSQQSVLKADQPIRFSMNTTASRVAVLIGDRQFVLQGAEAKQLYTSPEPVTEFEVTDDGSQLFVVTSRNRLVRIQVDTQEAEEIYGPMIGDVRETSYGTYPGSAVRFQANGFTEDLTFAVGDFVFPVAKIAADEFQVQVPWEFPPSDHTQTFRISSSNSPFDTRGDIGIDNVPRPYIFTVPYNPDALASQQDFSGTVSQANPAPAGSTIHLWLSGLGPLDREVKTGQPGPAEPPARPLTPFACYLYQVSNEKVTSVAGLRLPFLAYAPGLIGLYQLDATIPDGWPAGKSTISCTTDNKTATAYAQIWIR